MVAEAKENFLYTFLPGEQIGAVAYRFETETVDILSRTRFHAAENRRFLWAKKVSDLLLPTWEQRPGTDCSALVKIPDSQRDIAEMKVWSLILWNDLLGSAPSGDVVILDVVKKIKEKPFREGKLVVAGSDEETCRGIWDYYQNAGARFLAAIVGGMTEDGSEPTPWKIPAAVAPGLPGLWIPLKPPFEFHFPVAPASPSSSAARADAAHVADVMSPDVAKLGKWLRDVETAVDAVLQVRDRGRKSLEKAQSLCVSLKDLDSFMNEVAAHDEHPDWPTREPVAARAAAFEALHALQVAACEKMLGEAGNAVVSHFNPSLPHDIIAEIDKLHALQSGAEGMALLRRVLATNFALLPVHSLRTKRLKSTELPSVIEYACSVAARIGIAFADSPSPAHRDRVRTLLASHAHAGEDSASLLEYCVACTNGAEDGRVLAHTAPWSCLSVVAQFQAMSELPKFIAGKGRTTDAEGLTGVLGSLCDRLEPIVDFFSGTPKTRDRSHPELRARVKKLLDAYESPEEEIGKDESLELALSAFETAELTKTIAAGIIRTLKSPFASAWTKLSLPKLALDGASGIGIAYGVIAGIAGALDEAPESEKKEDKARKAIESSKKYVGYAGVGMKGANYLRTMVNKTPIFTTEGALAWCGRATFVLAAALSYYDAIRDLQHADSGLDKSAAALKLFGTTFLVMAKVATVTGGSAAEGAVAATAAEGAVVATATEGAAAATVGDVTLVEGAAVMAGATAAYILVAIAVPLLVVGAAIENRRAIGDFFHGKGQALFDAMTTDDARNGLYFVEYARLFGFEDSLKEFKTKFGERYFNELAIVQRNLAYNDAHRVNAGPKI